MPEVVAYLLVLLHLTINTSLLNCAWCLCPCTSIILMVLIIGMQNSCVSLAYFSISAKLVFQALQWLEVKTEVSKPGWIKSLWMC